MWSFGDPITFGGGDLGLVSRWNMAPSPQVVSLESYMHQAQDVLLDHVVKIFDVHREWGQNINESRLDLATARIQLIYNDAVRRLPPLVKDLQGKIAAMGSVCASLNLPSSAQFEGTRERTSLASNALEFGKQTVSITAAPQVALSGDKASMRKVLVHKALLPKRLSAHLESLVSDGESGASGADPASAANLKRSNTSADPVGMASAGESVGGLVAAPVAKGSNVVAGSAPKRRKKSSKVT